MSTLLPPVDQRRFLASLEALEVARARELAALTDADALNIIRSLRLFTEGGREQREISGLVEQQKLFRRAQRHDRP